MLGSPQGVMRTRRLLIGPALIIPQGGVFHRAPCCDSALVFGGFSEQAISPEERFPTLQRQFLRFWRDR
jgi:hypothetical protein